MHRVLLDCERMKYPNTGLFTYCQELGTALLQRTMEVEELFFYMPPKLGPYFGPEAQYIWQQSLHKLYLPHQEKMDVWHTPYQSSPYRSSRKGMRKVITIHDLNFLHEHKSAAKVKRYLAAVQRNIDDADVLTCISRFAKEEVLQHLNTRDKPFHVIYNGATVKEFPGFETPCYKPERPFFFAMGTVLPKKNFHVLPCLLANLPHELVIAGNINDNYLDVIMAEARKFGVRERVRILGPVSEEDKYWYLKNCSAFLFPSLAEGFGLPVIEAMHFGKPVFLSDRTSLPEIGGDAAYYFHDFDAAYMQSVVEDGLAHHERLQRADAVREHAAQFNWHKAATAYLEIYRSLY